MRARLSAIAIAVATLVAGTTVGTTTGTAAAGPGEETVTLTIKVAGCGGCQLRLVQLRDNDPDSYWETPTQEVDHGQVVFEVPADKTQGTSIWIDAPWDTVYVHGAQYVAIRYGGFSPGDPVTKRTATHAGRGSRCWSGTDDDQTIHVRVVRVHYGSAPEVGLRAFANPTLPSTDMTEIYKGSIVTTYPFCPAP